MFLHKKFRICRPGEASIFNALSYNITFYSGILVNQEYLNYNDCGNGLVDAFLYPFLKILQKKSFLYLPKITIISKTGKDNLAFTIYNSNTDNIFELNKVLSKLLQKEWVAKPCMYELINYKIYCRSKSKKYRYYKYLMTISTVLNKILSTVVYFIPSIILRIFKVFILNLNGRKTMKYLRKYYSYIFG